MNVCMASDADRPLRTAIDTIIEEYQVVEYQVAALERLHSTHAHTVRQAKLSDLVGVSDGDTPEYNCFAFALDLIDCPERIAVGKYAPRTVGPIRFPGIADVLPDANFLWSLMLTPQYSLQNCRDHDLVIYCDKFGYPQHAGKVIAGAVISKWGMKGGLWPHSLWEVPSSYGTSLRFYSHLSKEHVRQKWVEYLQRLARRVSGFLYLASVIHENEGKGLSHKELLRLAAEKAARPVRDRPTTNLPNKAIETDA